MPPLPRYLLEITLGSALALGCASPSPRPLVSPAPCPAVPAAPAAPPLAFADDAALPRVPPIARGETVSLGLMPYYGPAPPTYVYAYGAPTVTYTYGYGAPTYGGAAPAAYYAATTVRGSRHVWHFHPSNFGSSFWPRTPRYTPGNPAEYEFNLPLSAIRYR